jgi:hypothetical protein
MKTTKLACNLIASLILSNNYPTALTKDRNFSYTVRATFK